MLMSTVGKWLSIFDMSTYESILLTNGFDDIEFLVIKISYDKGSISIPISKDGGILLNAGRGYFG
jgi:hypothetical protein